jgi:hypothetical protein
MSKHTPGPWHTLTVYADHEVRTSESQLVAVVSALRCESEENARLIAAAPDLLEALELCLSIVRLQNGNRHSDINEIIGTARSAIAKATGEQS